MANTNFRAPDPTSINASDNASASSNGQSLPHDNAAHNASAHASPHASAHARGAGGVPRRASVPLHRLSQSERGEDELAGAEGEPGNSLSLYQDGPGETAIESADDASMREFYGRLVTLLTQDGEGETARKKGRGGVLTALRRRWLPALLLSGLAFYGLYSALQPRQATFSASTQLLLPPRAMAGDKDPFASPEDSYDTQAQVAIVGSENIVRSALAKVPPELKQRGWGNRDAQVVPVSVNALDSDSLINITTSSNDPKASLALVNEMVRAYGNYIKTRYSSNRNDNLQATKKRVADTQSELEKARRDLRRYKDETGIFNAESQQNSSTTSISDLQNQLSAARREAATITADDSNLQGLRQKAVDAGVNLQNVLRDFTAESERGRLAQAEYTRAQAQAEERAQSLVESSRARIAQLEESLARARQRASELPAAEQQLSRLNQRVAIAEAAYQAASDRASQLALGSGTVTAVAKPLRSPGVSNNLGMQKARALAVSLLGALALGLLGAIVLDRLDRSVRATPDPESLFEAPVLGALPVVGGRAARFIGNSDARGGAKTRTAMLEACYSAQAHILSAASNLGARSILITSSLPEEGKSQCAANLAAAMAYGGRQVLLIDVDFWNPSQNEILEQELGPGYAQVLRDELPLSQAIRATQVPNLHLLTAGQKVLPRTKANPGNSAELIELLSGESHFQVQQVLKRYFDVIIIDAPPVMSVSDAQLLSGLSDSTVLVAADHTKRDQVQRARSMLRLAGAVLLGVVINSVRLGEVQRWNVDFTPEEPFANYTTSLSRR